MKVLAYILTAAAVLIGADVFVQSAEGQSTDTTAVAYASASSPITLHGGNGRPTPPPD